MTNISKIIIAPTIFLFLFLTVQVHGVIETIDSNYSDETYTKTVASGDTLIYDVPETAREGGAIKVYGTGLALSITTGEGATVIFQNNSAIDFGGAIRSSQGDIVLQNTVFIENKSISLDGGAIYVTGNLTLNVDDNRTLSSYGNTATRQGGFLFLSGSGTVATFNIGQNSIYTIGNINKSDEDSLYTSYSSFRKTGTGQLVVNSNADWGGVADVEAGVLEINAEWYFNGTGSLNVESGATLMGGGNFYSPVNLHRMVTIKEGGILSPGSGVGTITFADLTLEGGSILRIEKGDSISVTNLTLDNLASKIEINLIGFSGEVSDVAIFENISVINVTSGLEDYFEISNFEGIVSYADGKILINGTATPIPEPNIYVMFVGALALGFTVCRRRKAV